MSLWVDRYRPNTLSKLTLHHEVNKKLLALSASEELPHLLVYGPPGNIIIIIYIVYIYTLLKLDHLIFFYFNVIIYV